jgi:hypothetical protein
VAIPRPRPRPCSHHPPIPTRLPSRLSSCHTSCLSVGLVVLPPSRMSGPPTRCGPAHVDCNIPSLVVSLLDLGAAMPRSRAQETTSRTMTTSTVSVGTEIQPSALLTLHFSTISRDTTMSLMSISTDPASPELIPAVTNNNTKAQSVHDGTVFNYYFLFLAAFGVSLAAALWWLHQKRKRRKQQLRLSGQRALARDLEGWAGTRRLMHGRYGRHYASAHTMRVEGLDEHGEAPPPYHPKHNVTIRAVPDPGNDVAIPLRTLKREDSDRRQPPEYSSGAHIRS